MKLQPKTLEQAVGDMTKTLDRFHTLDRAARLAAVRLRYMEHMVEAMKAGDPKGKPADPGIHIMLHALGWSQDRNGRQRVGGWRNHYATDPEHWAWEEIAALVCDGYMAWVPRRLDVSEHHVAMVTLKGMQHLRAHGFTVTDAWGRDE